MKLTETQIDEIVDEIAKKELNKEKIKQTIVDYLEMQEANHYEKPEEDEGYKLIRINSLGTLVWGMRWENDDADNRFYDSGNYFKVEDEGEAQHFADMLNYVFLVQKKAREMGGLLGYAHQVPDDVNLYNLVWFRYKLNVNVAAFRYERHPLTPLLTKECAEILAKDPEIIESAKKAWGVE